MANEQNLIPITKRSREEALRMSHKGGQATKEKKAKAKTLSEKYTIALEILRNRAKKTIAGDSELEKVLDETDVLVLEKLKILLSKETRKEVKLKVLESIEDRLHGKPKQVTDIDITSKGEQIRPQIIIGD